MKKTSQTIEQIFVAHAKEDKLRVRKLCNEMENYGLKVWFDEKSLEIGSQWQNEIRNAIKHSRFFLACISQNSISKKGFVQNELREALSTLESLPQNETYLLPVLLDKMEVPEIRVGTINLADYHCFRVYNQKEKRRLFVYLMKSLIAKNENEYDKPAAGTQYDLDYPFYIKAKNILLTLFPKFHSEKANFNSIDSDEKNLKFGMNTFYGEKGWIISIDIQVQKGIIFCHSELPAPFDEEAFDAIKDFTFKYNNQFKIGTLILDTGRFNIIKFRHAITATSFNESELKNLVYICLDAMNYLAPEIWDLNRAHNKNKSTNDASSTNA